MHICNYLTRFYVLVRFEKLVLDHVHVYFVMSCLQRSYWSKYTLLGKYRANYSHISCILYILSSISEFHGIPQSNFNRLKEKSPKKHLVKKQFGIHFWESKVKVYQWWPLTWPLWNILDAPNERKFYELQVAQIVGHKVKVWSHTTSNAETDCGWMFQETLCKNQVSSKSVMVMYFLRWNDPFSS